MLGVRSTTSPLSPTKSKLNPIAPSSASPPSSGGRSSRRQSNAFPSPSPQPLSPTTQRLTTRSLGRKLAQQQQEEAQEVSYPPLGPDATLAANGLDDVVKVDGGCDNADLRPNSTDIEPSWLDIPEAGEGPEGSDVLVDGQVGSDATNGLSHVDNLHQSNGLHPENESFGEQGEDRISVSSLKLTQMTVISFVCPFRCPERLCLRQFEPYGPICRKRT